MIVPSLCVALLCGCGTKYIAELDPQELASSSDDGGATTTSGAEGPGQTVTSGVETTGGESTGGAAVECEPDPMAVCGDPPMETVAAVPPAAPESGGGLPLVTEYDCTITELEYVQADFSTVMLDCGLENPTYAGTALDQVTFDKLAVDDAVHVAFAMAEDGNGSSFALSRDGQLVYMVMAGTTIDPIPGTDVFAPFEVTAQEDVCLAPCDVGEYCYGQDRQILDFAVDGVEVASLWSSTNTTIDLDGVQYLIEVGIAYGAEVVNPDSFWCDMPGYGSYGFRIADVTP
ncbi:MAG TPA: hypothetical protein VG755_25715 [Nannocystaceae bacterium]|nr:hypothetical protein [Nannocystaceae bacterium]